MISTNCCAARRTECGCAAYLLRPGRDRTEADRVYVMHQGEIAHSALTGPILMSRLLCALPSAIVSVRRVMLKFIQNNREITALLAVVLCLYYPVFSTASI